VYGKRQFPLVQLPKKFKVFPLLCCLFFLLHVSISSTSEEVQSSKLFKFRFWHSGFPLVQLPKKFKDMQLSFFHLLVPLSFPLVQLPKKFKALGEVSAFDEGCQVSISSTSEEVQRKQRGNLDAVVGVFPLVQLPKKFKALLVILGISPSLGWFPLVQLPKKFKVEKCPDSLPDLTKFPLVQLPKKFKVLALSIMVAAAGCCFH